MRRWGLEKSRSRPGPGASRERLLIDVCQTNKDPPDTTRNDGASAATCMWGIPTAGKDENAFAWLATTVSSQCHTYTTSFRRSDRYASSRSACPLRRFIVYFGVKAVAVETIYWSTKIDKPSSSLDLLQERSRAAAVLRADVYLSLRIVSCGTIGGTIIADMQLSLPSQRSMAGEDKQSHRRVTELISSRQQQENNYSPSI